MSKLICIDPGHGGPKPGAVGTIIVDGKSQRVAEKDVVWGTDHQAVGGIGVSNRVAHHLRKAGYRTILTRNADEDVDLAERARMAVRNKADLFVSIHCNSFGDPKANGIEAFVHPSQKNRAEVLARYILGDILKQPECRGIKDRGVKTAKFSVLAGTYASMPAVLVELPFISNAREAGLLADRFFREAAGRAIASAICRFLG